MNTRKKVMASVLGAACAVVVFSTGAAAPFFNPDRNQDSSVNISKVPVFGVNTDDVVDPISGTEAVSVFPVVPIKNDSEEVEPEVSVKDPVVESKKTPAVDLIPDSQEKPEESKDEEKQPTEDSSVDKTPAEDTTPSADSVDSPEVPTETPEDDSTEQPEEDLPDSSTDSSAELSLEDLCSRALPSDVDILINSMDSSFIDAMFEVNYGYTPKTFLLTYTYYYDPSFEQTIRNYFNCF